MCPETDNGVLNLTFRAQLPRHGGHRHRDANGAIETYVEGLQTPRGVARTIIHADHELTTEHVRLLMATLSAGLEEVEQ